MFIEYDIPDEAKIPIKTKRVRFSLSPESTRLYNSFTKTGVLAGHEIRNGRPLDPVEVTNLASQLSCGFIYDDMQLRISVAELKAATSVLDLLKKKNRRTLALFDDRINFADKILRAVKKKHNDCNVLICYHFKHELVQLTELLPDAVPDTADNFENDWNAGKIKHGLLQYNRSSESGNLQTGGCVMMMYSQTFSWKDFYQIPRRIARRGQLADTVYLYILHINGTVDDLKEQRMTNSTIGHKKFQKMIMRDL